MTPAQIHEEIRKSGGIVQPSPGDVHVNAALTNVSIAYAQAAGGFVCNRAFPEVPVMKQSDAYFLYDRSDWNRDDMTERRPGTESAGATYGMSTATYYARPYAIHKDIPDQVRANADMAVSPDRDATMFLTNKSMIQKERVWASQFLTDSVWSFSADGAASASGTLTFATDANNNLVYWSSAASTPIEDVRAMCRAVQQSTGFRPNVLVASRPVYDVLIEHDDIIGRLNRGQTTGPAMANRRDLAMLFELDEVLVMDAIHNDAAIGETADHEFIGGNNALLLYRPSSPGLMTPSAGYMFSWRAFIGGGMMGQRIKKFRMEELASDRVEIESAYDFKLVSADLGCFIDDIVQ